ncbi:MAG: hypothetical protein LBD77_05030 [Bifidobacteriaceae bacterium]|nr:hypothetical protein [Bifidobacteriaceae bacterium]
MSNIKYVYKLKAQREIRTWPATFDFVNKAAAALAAAAGPDFEAKPAKATGGRGRARAAVVAGSPKARRAQAEHGNLQRALGSVRI